MKVTATSTGSLTDALDDLNRSLTKAQKDVGRTVAGVGRRVILEEAKRKRKGSLSMSGIPLKRLGASAKITATPTRAVVTLVAKPAGPWSITEYGTVRGSPPFGIWAQATAGGADSDIERAVTATFDEAMNQAMEA